MRRGLTNKISFILILIVSIATLFSYLSDQLAINTEDKLRKNKIEYENHLNKLYTYNAIDTFLIQVDGNIELHSYSFLLKRNFYIKQLLIIEHETKTSNLLKDILKNEKGEYASISSDSFFSKQDWSLKNLKWNLMSEVMDILLLIEDTHQQYDLFYRANKKKINEIKKKNTLKDLYQFHRLGSQEPSIKKLKGIKKTQKLFFDTKNEDEQDNAIDNFSIDDWINVYRYKMVLLKNINSRSKILDKFGKTIYDKTLVLEDQQIALFSKQKKLNARKNYFILFSIVFQILALFFLLLLFKNLLKMKTN